MFYDFILQWPFDNTAEVKIPNAVYADRSRRLLLYRRQKKKKNLSCICSVNGRLNHRLCGVKPQ